MHPVLSQNLFFVKEHVGFFKAANNFDVFDPATGDVIIECREPKLGFFTKLLRFTDYKRMTPFDVRLTTPGGDPILSVKRGVSVLLSKVRVYDENDTEIGGFQQKFFSLGGKFEVLDETGSPLCTLKGKWTGWDFRFVTKDAEGEIEFAHVSKKWSGMGKEMFTSADNYMLQIDDDVEPDDDLRVLILAAVMCIDMVLKE